MRILFSIAVSWLSIFMANARYSDTLSIQGSKGSLFTILQTPEAPSSAEKYPLVIICHGFKMAYRIPIRLFCGEDEIRTRGRIAPTSV